TTILPSSNFSRHNISHHHHLHSFPTRRSSDLSCRRSSASSTSDGIQVGRRRHRRGQRNRQAHQIACARDVHARRERRARKRFDRSEEHTSELQSRGHLVCRLLLEKKKKQYKK